MNWLINLFKKFANWVKGLFSKEDPKPIIVVKPTIPTEQPKEEPKVEEPKEETPEVEEPLVNVPKDIDIFYRVANYVSHGEPSNFAGIFTCMIDQINWPFQVAFGAAYCSHGQITDEYVNTLNLHCQNTIKSCSYLSGTLRAESHDGRGSHCNVSIYFRDENKKTIAKVEGILADTLGKEIHWGQHSKYFMMKDVDSILVHFEYR